MPVLNGILKKVDLKLKKLEKGKILDVPNLSRENVESLQNFYSQSCLVLGPSIDKENSKPNKNKYVLSFIKYQEEIQNA
jgi:hypothetical protein